MKYFVNRFTNNLSNKEKIKMKTMIEHGVICGKDYAVENNLDIHKFNDLLKIALFLGLMYNVLSDMEDVDDVDEKEDEDEISDELAGAKKYFQKYLDTHDSQFHNMAGDELNHALILIRKENSKLLGHERKNKLKHYEDVASQIADLLAR